METELDIIDSLNGISYKGNCLQVETLTKALESGIRNADLRELICWLATELHILRKTDEEVSADLNDPNEFAMELSALLKELGCPFQRFVSGPLSERFETREACLELLDYLITEMMATRMSVRLQPADETFIIPKFETDTARALEQLSRDLGLEKPPENVATKAFFDKLNFKVEEKIRQIKPGVLSDPLLRTEKQLSEAQWKQLESMQADLEAEYNMRRQVLLTRLEVTIQSFQWSDSMKKKEKEIAKRFEQKLRELEAFKTSGEAANIVALLAARSDLAIIEKTSSANVRKNTGSKIQKHVIGSVPDRGGRAHEHAPPPPEMPSWQQQRASGPGGGGGRGGGGNFRGGRGGQGGGGHGGGGYGGGGQGGGYSGGQGGGYGGGQGGGYGGGQGGGQARGNWQQYSSQQQRPQQYEQRPQFEQGRDQNWVSGSGRVQGGGWNQRGNDFDRGGNNSRDGNDRHSGGGDGNYRGRSNYNRGGGRR